MRRLVRPNLPAALRLKLEELQVDVDRAQAPGLRVADIWKNGDKIALPDAPD